jgi:hypothetical protein
MFVLGNILKAPIEDGGAFVEAVMASTFVLEHRNFIGHRLTF